MAIKLQVVSKSQPGMTGGGSVKYYAQVGSRGKVTAIDLSRTIEKSSSLTEGDVIAVITHFTNLIPELLMDGYTIELERLGMFSLHVRSEGNPDPDKVSVHSIKEARIHFRPGVELKRKLQTADYTIVARKY